MLNQVEGNRWNQSVIKYLKSGSNITDLELILDENELEKERPNLKVHPDIIELLWNDYAKEIPVRCHAIFLGKPVLINPDTGIIFGFAEGTNPLLLRLPKAQIDILLEQGGKIVLSSMDGIYADAKQIGNDWIYCFSFIEDLEKYFLAAYNYSNENSDTL